ncbi:MAG: hypothetical protein P4L26_17815 [Terracidiphilus sp.]|nr:hypothetical protein [Terracidiphilus sp.]
MALLIPALHRKLKKKHDRLLNPRGALAAVCKLRQQSSEFSPRLAGTDYVHVNAE